MLVWLLRRLKREVMAGLTIYLRKTRFLVYFLQMEKNQILRIINFMLVSFLTDLDRKIGTMRTSFFLRTDWLTKKYNS